MKLIKFGFLIIFIISLCECKEKSNEDEDMKNRESLFLCDYYIKHLNKIKSPENSKGIKMLGKIKLSCDDAFLVRNKLFEIFKEIDNNKYVNN